MRLIARIAPLVPALALLVACASTPEEDAFYRPTEDVLEVVSVLRLHVVPQHGMSLLLPFPHRPRSCRRLDAGRALRPRPFCLGHLPLSPLSSLPPLSALGAFFLMRFSCFIFQFYFKPVV